jgi:hypothetical protein
MEAIGKACTQAAADGKNDGTAFLRRMVAGEIAINDILK